MLRKTGPLSVVWGGWLQARRADADAVDFSVLDVCADARGNGRGAQGLQLMESLEKMAVKASLVAHDLVEVDRKSVV